MKGEESRGDVAARMSTPRARKRSKEDGPKADRRGRRKGTGLFYDYLEMPEEG